MKIAIDARMYGLKHAGIGRYTENLVANVLKQDNKNSYVLLVRKEESSNKSIKYLVDKYPRKLKLLIADARHYTIKEQLLLPYILSKEKPDLVHFPHFNIPVFYSGKFVVTIHDLLWHEVKGKGVTTLPGYFYYPKYLGYRFVFSQAIKRAQKILVPSEWVKNKLKDTYKDINSNKIIVTYEGIDKPYNSKQLTANSKKILTKYKLEKPFIVYTGSAYPHKNLTVLLGAIKILNTSNLPDSNIKIHLLIACSRDVFWDKLKEQVEEVEVSEFVRLPGFVPDEELKILYQNALAFVFPSLSEGFGLPGLEAMACGCSVLCSDIPVFHEVYQDAAIYFNPYDVNDLVEKIKSVINYNTTKYGEYEELRKKGIVQAQKYSWKKMARETVGVYETCIRWSEEKAK